MKIKVLGTRGEIEESCLKHKKHSGVLIDGKLLLDLGEKETGGPWARKRGQGHRSL